MRTAIEALGTMCGFVLACVGLCLWTLLQLMVMSIVGGIVCIVLWAVTHALDKVDHSLFGWLLFP